MLAIFYRIVRPLLFAPRKEIMEYALAHKVPFREDSSNNTTKYLRNKIRLGLVPRIREINPKFTELMRTNLGRLIDAQRFIDSTIARIRESNYNDDGLRFIAKQLNISIALNPERLTAESLFNRLQ